MKQKPNPENQPEIATEESDFEPQQHPEKPEFQHNPAIEDNICNCHRIFHKHKWLWPLIIFLAGMGFNELFHGGFRNCRPSEYHQIPMHHIAPLPLATDGAGSMIIINTDGTTATPPFHNCDCEKRRKHHKTENCTARHKPQQTQQPRVNPIPLNTPQNHVFQENP